MLNSVRIPINRKLALIYGVLMAALVLAGGLSVFALDRLEDGARRVAERYSVQLDRISDVQMLMFRISLEARHAMLVTTPEARAATFERVGAARKQMLDTLSAFEADISTDTGRQTMQRIREADAVFWRLAGEVTAKIQAGDMQAAFAQLEAELVPARDTMVGHIASQRRWQQLLVLNTVQAAQKEASRTKLAVLVVALVSAVLAAWMAWSLARMMHGAFSRAQSVTQRIAAGNLSGDIYVRKGDEFGQLFESIVDMQSRLLSVVARVREVAASIMASAHAIDQANRDLSSASTTQAGSVRETAASARRMHEVVEASNASVQRVHALARDAAEVAGRGGEVVEQVVSTMRGIDGASKRIADIVGVIDGIAFQTNILALNAAVEAARAGEQGRGFAVVAGEVRTLAQRSASAAREVRALIDDSVQRAGSGARLADDAGQTIRTIVESVSQVTELMHGVADSAKAQGQDVGAVAGAVAHIDDATARSSAAVARSAEAARALREHAQALEAAVSAFNLGREQLQALRT